MRLQTQWRLTWPPTMAKVIVHQSWQMVFVLCMWPCQAVRRRVCILKYLSYWLCIWPCQAVRRLVCILGCLLLLLIYIYINILGQIRPLVTLFFHIYIYREIYANIIGQVMLPVTLFCLFCWDFCAPWFFRTTNVALLIPFRWACWHTKVLSKWEPADGAKLADFNTYKKKCMYCWLIVSALV